MILWFKNRCWFIKMRISSNQYFQPRSCPAVLAHGVLIWSRWDQFHPGFQVYSVIWACSKPTLGKQIKQIPGTAQMVFKSYLRLALVSFGTLLCFCLSRRLLYFLPFSLCVSSNMILNELSTPTFGLLDHCLMFLLTLSIYLPFCLSPFLSRAAILRSPTQRHCSSPQT